MQRFVSLLAFGLFAFGITPSHATPPSTLPESWAGMNRITNVIKSERHQIRSISVTPGDALLEFWSNEQEGAPDGALLLTRDRFFAVRGLEIEQSRSVKPLGDALVCYVVLDKLLARALPDGPRSVRESTPVDVVEPAVSISVAIPGQRVVLSAPWHLEGQVVPQDNGRFSYDLTLTAAGDEPMLLEGSIECAPDLTIELPDSLPLIGWKTYKIKRVETRSPWTVGQRVLARGT